MNDLQSKFAITLVAFGLLFAYAIRTLGQAEHEVDAAMRVAGAIYMAPNQNDPGAPSGMVSAERLREYSDKKAAERKAKGLQ
ncbi:MAG TPA: hypothetical protein VKB47_05190 [Terracidiphilus sp.]|nr:hypothetical protein [Terracidiphilus sp.]